MRLFSTLSLLSFLTGFVYAEFQMTRHVSLAPRLQHAAVLPKAEFSSTFTSRVPRGKYKKHLLAVVHGKHRESGGTIVPVAGTDLDKVYLTNLTVGGQEFSVIVDTGSSDTWVIQQGFNCSDLDGSPVPAATCALGAEFSPSHSKTFHSFPNMMFNVQYGSGEFLSGPVGFDNITIGGLQVSQQEIGVPDAAAFLGDGISSGVIGFAYPRLTSVYNTTNSSGRVHVSYNPFFLSAVDQKKVKNPYFSIALNRAPLEQEEHDNYHPNLGVIAFGGIAPVPVLDTAVTVPVQGYTFTFTGPVPNNTDPTYIWYTVDVESYTFTGSNSVLTANNNTIVDTGSTLNWVPTDVAVTYNALFTPPAILDQDLQLYVIPCNATAPPFSVSLGGKVFTIDVRDQIVPNDTDAAGNIVCITGTQDGGLAGGTTIFTLGDVFLRNVVATFNPVADEVTFTQRAPY